jgi:hypothetical protein
MRNIAFGYENVGAVTVIIKRASDGYFWGGSVWQAAAPVPALDMTFDADLDQYYSEEAPSERCYYTAFDSVGAISYGEYGGGFPDVSVGSASAYTMQEVVDRLRTEISDPDDGNPRFTDVQLLNILDRCIGWLTDQCYKKKTTVGVGTAVYTGDGTTEWGLPATFFGLLYLADPTIYKGGQLKQATKLDYDQGGLAASSIRTRYYCLMGTNLYFIRDLATGGTINLYFYPKIAKTTVSTTVPFDGLFIDLMVEWGKTIALATDEFSIDRFQSGMLSIFMGTAKAYMVTRSAGPMRARVRSREFRNVRRGKMI